jgi:hypothetical protein
MGFEYNDGCFPTELGWHAIVAVDRDSPSLVDMPCQWCESLTIPKRQLKALELAD